MQGAPFAIRRFAGEVPAGTPPKKLPPKPNRAKEKNDEHDFKGAHDGCLAGGRFILSTGDQCGRDTREENIFAMVEVCKTYGKY